jgi:YD repeat-containing protein
LWEQNASTGNATRTTTYTYYASGSPFAGLLATKTDGRGVTCTYSYDNWLHDATNVCTGLLSEENLTTVRQYEPRGYVTNYAEWFASTNTGPATSVQRTFDPYGQVATEAVSDGAFAYNAFQTWDATGRRSQLNVGNASYGYGWQADGSLTNASNPTGSGTYTYDTAGLLTKRQAGNRLTSITARDGEGRPLAITNTLNTVPELGETLSWSGDGLLAAHTLARPDFADNRR